MRIYKDKSGRLWTKPGEGRTQTDSLPFHRITNEEVALKLTGTEDIRNMSRTEKASLIDAGFKAVNLSDGTVIILF